MLDENIRTAFKGEQINGQGNKRTRTKTGQRGLTENETKDEATPSNERKFLCANLLQ